ncbi:hypothetical protein [Luteimonas sp. FCS-9]|uniref:hypothetical protein n=1 Tax=Luteimonas sp. FCS-9 TaxID=1547516 RepID=UPI0012DFFC23|nr:hypothetical protein [Luteimonas sp. FCS-9]
MDSGTISILLSLAGLVLGFVAAYGQIKRFFVKALGRGGEAIRAINAREAERATMFLTYPSAFTAFVVRRVSFATFLIFLALNLPTLLNLSSLDMPGWFITTARLIPSSLAGLLLGGLTSASSDVIREARKASSRGG